MENTRSLGRIGENLAASYYESCGYSVLCRNWRYRKLGELDIIAEKGNVLVVSEVKLRKDCSFAPASAAVNLKKQKRIKLLSEIYLLQNPDLLQKYLRFDVAQVDFGEKIKIDVITDAF